MKRSRLEVVIIVLAMLFVAGWSLFIMQTVNKSHLYSLTTVVTYVSEANDTVTVKDFNGNLWQFKGVEDWDEGDICSCVMDSKGTNLIKDDEIVSTHYSGYFKGWQ